MWLFNLIYLYLFIYVFVCVFWSGFTGFIITHNNSSFIKLLIWFSDRITLTSSSDAERFCVHVVYRKIWGVFMWGWKMNTWYWFKRSIMLHPARVEHHEWFVLCRLDCWNKAWSISQLWPRTKHTFLKCHLRASSSKYCIWVRSRISRFGYHVFQTKLLNIIKGCICVTPCILWAHVLWLGSLLIQPIRSQQLVWIMYQLVCEWCYAVCNCWWSRGLKTLKEHHINVSLQSAELLFLCVLN